MGGGIRRRARSLAASAALLSVAPLVALASGASAVSPLTGTAGVHAPFAPGATPVGRNPWRAPFSVVAGATAISSSNWSGYAQKGKKGTFTSVQATWSVPTVTVHAGSQYASDWVGIGGFSDRTLVQAGTESDVVNGQASYDAWTEILPAASVELSMTVSAGDSVTTLVQETAPGTWLMRVTDNTTTTTEQRIVAYASSGRSVEAIHEATSICDPRCAIATLATTTNVTFDPGTYTSLLQPTAQPLLQPAVVSQRHTRRGTVTKVAKLYSLVMTGSGGGVIATPSLPDADSDGFSLADGSAIPPSPSS